MSTSIMRAPGTFLLLIALSGIAGARDYPPLQCPPGTSLRLQTIKDPDVRVESCVDKDKLRQGPARTFRAAGPIIAELMFVDDQRHGVMRSYDEAGETAIHETVFEHGKKVSSGFTLAGLRQMAATLNENASKEDKAWRIRVLDLHRLEYTTTVGLPFSLLEPDDEDVSRLRERFVSDPRMCAMFTMAEVDIHAIHAIYVKTDGKQLANLVIRREECTAAQR
jgi:hypothetical protein